MKVYSLQYTGIVLGILIVPKALAEDENTQDWFKQFDIPPINAIELDSSQVTLGNKSLQEWENEYYESKEHNSKMRKA
jgi:hypothetical protein